MGDGATGVDYYRGYIQYKNSADAMCFATSNSERMRISSGGDLFIGGTSDANADFVFSTSDDRASFYRRLLMGTSTSRSIGAGAAYPAFLQVESSGFTNTSFTQNSNDLYGPEINLGKSRGTSAGGTTVVQSGDQLGVIQFAGADGTDLETNGAIIECRVDGTPGSNDMPGRLVFYTTADGASSPTERMRITSSSGTQIRIVGSTSADSGALQFVNNSQAIQWHLATNSTNLYIADADFSNYAYLSQNPTAWQFASDARLKENIKPLDYGIDTVKQIKPCSFNFIGNDIPQIGFIAQDLKTVVPEAVSGEEIDYGNDDTPEERAKKSMGLSKETLVPVLVKALQETITKIETLEQRLSDAGIA